MIYAIISKNDTPVNQMHIYLQNKTGNDGGMIPELFSDLSVSESVNSLYAFATACVLTDNFTNIPSGRKEFPSDEVAILSLIQYLKGMATSIQLNKKCVTPLYENLKTANILGSAPTLLNLDGDLFGVHHYDESLYHSKEAADEAEDSFPYWIINIVKEIKESNELVTPKKGVVYQLPYFVQNISQNPIKIYDSPNKNIQKEIGLIPPTGIEPVESIIYGFGKLATSKEAYIELNDNIIIPIKHLESMDELKGDTKSLKIPTPPFDIEIKVGCLCNAGFGISNHFYSDDDHSYKEGDVIHIDDIFLDSYGIIDEKYYIELNPLYVFLSNQPSDDQEHTKKEDNEDTTNEISIMEEDLPFKNSKYLVIVKTSSGIDTAYNILTKINKKMEYPDAYIDVVNEHSITIVITGTSDESEAIKTRKKILSTIGVKASVIPYSDFY